ncbi:MULTISPECIES: DUF4344 domain-containing metallopeptidase [Rhizobium/Agrobacterium group]|uniref:DUF4344 domain-containing metallopeptidase n=1 Tax=Rhizobium/Agrobacterium group TaxID=227290 RepID=UPI00230025DD|nr:MULTISPECIES: DUF4344 domain-containing metallopeptidase [Rhizobium/Agrobacterium group]MDA5632590.1 DUF4344 domain-containing metallopeptidase [Agrobacterium sp. ST15.16.024]MDF1888455.1 DUF4344 domain-containing metallopeptidase [Rhizobium rhizogenes]
MLRRFLAAIPLAFVSLTAPAQAQTAAGLDGLSDDQLQQAVNFVIGNAIFALYHEGARMLISDFGTVETGSAQAPADQLAGTLILQANEEWLDTALVNATDSWYLGREAETLPEHEAPVFSALIPDKSRDRNMACLMVGRDKDGYGDLAAMMGLDNAEFDKCAAAYPRVASAWENFLSPHRSQTPSKFTVSYMPPRDPELEPYAIMIRESKVLDLISRSFGAYDLKGDVKLTARTCGRPDVYWSAEKREITYCYELGKFQAELIADHLLNTVTEDKGAAGGQIPTAVNLEREI